MGKIFGFLTAGNFISLVTEDALIDIQTTGKGTCIVESLADFIIPGKDFSVFEGSLITVEKQS